MLFLLSFPFKFFFHHFVSSFHLFYAFIPYLVLFVLFNIHLFSLPFSYSIISIHRFFPHFLLPLHIHKVFISSFHLSFVLFLCLPFFLNALPDTFLLFSFFPFHRLPPSLSPVVVFVTVHALLYFLFCIFGNYFAILSLALPCYFLFSSIMFHPCFLSLLFLPFLFLLFVFSSPRI